MRLDWLPTDAIKVLRTVDDKPPDPWIPTRRAAMMIDLIRDIEEEITKDRQVWVEFYLDGRRTHVQVKKHGGVRKDRQGDAAYDPSATGGVAR